MKALLHSQVQNLIGSRNPAVLEKRIQVIDASLSILDQGKKTLKNFQTFNAFHIVCKHGRTISDNLGLV